MLVVGLGNPGSRYLGTRHNVGFEVVDRLVGCWKAREQPSTAHYQLWMCERAEHPVWLMKPRTFMNRSGEAIASFAATEGMSPADLLEPGRRPMIIVDDMALAVGRLRFRARGRDGGHNGLASVADVLGTDAYDRLRIGVGPPPPVENWVEFVLTGFRTSERKVLNTVYDHAVSGLDTVLSQGLSRAMSEFNRVNLAPDDDESTDAG